MTNLYTPRISSTRMRSRGLLLFNRTWLPDRLSSRIEKGKERKGKRGRGKKRETNWTNCTVSMGIFNYLRGWSPVFIVSFHVSPRLGVAQLVFAQQIKVAYTLVFCFLYRIQTRDTSALSG